MNGFPYIFDYIECNKTINQYFHRKCIEDFKSHMNTVIVYVVTKPDNALKGIIGPNYMDFKTNTLT